MERILLDRETSLFKGRAKTRPGSPTPNEAKAKGIGA